MNPSDTTTTAVLTAVRQAVDAAAPSGGPDAGLPRVMAAARSRRGRGRVLAGGLAGGALAAGAALTVALTGTAAGPAVAGGAVAGPAAGTGRAAAGPAAGAAGSNARLAAWSVRAAPDGSVTLTLHQLTDAAGLKQALAAHQVPALLHFGAGACSADGAALRDVPVGIYRFSPSTSGERVTLGVITATFNTALWPAGSELYIAGSPLGPQVSVIPQGHYQGCA
jgi:hypothetical protein